MQSVKRLDGNYMPKQSSVFQFVAKTTLPTTNGSLEIHAFRNTETGHEPIAIVSGTLSDLSSVPLRVHDACFTSEVFGTLEGEIKVEEVLNLRDTSKIYGNIYTSKLKIDEGAFFEGSCKMSSSISREQESSSLMSDLIKEEDLLEE